MTTTETEPATASGIPYRVAPRAVLIAEKERQIQEYEQIYELSSEKMADLVDNDKVKPSVEVIKWYHIYDGLQFLLETTPTAGTRGTITKLSMTAD